MKLVPYYGDQPIIATDVEIRVDPKDQKRIWALVERTSAVTEVSDDLTFGAARRAAGELKALLDEIEADRKASKGSFDAVGRAIQDLAADLSGPLKNQQNRILGLLNTYVAKLEAARKEQERREAEARRLALEEAERKINEAKDELKTAQYEIERVKLQNKVLQRQLEAELAADVEDLGKNDEPAPGLVPGGRVNHVYDFELVSVQTTCNAGHYRLLKWSLDIRACQDAIKSQLETAPHVEPFLPGIRITKRLSVSVKAASRIK